jgi:hypothetical protein
MNYLVHIPQSDYLHTARITAEEREEYLKRLESFDEDLIIDYSDDNLPFYDLDRQIDDFSVKDAKHFLTIAEAVEDLDPKVIESQKWIQEELKKQQSARSLLNDWFVDFEEVIRIQNT